MLYHKSYILSPESEWVVFVHGAGGSSAIWYKQLKAFIKHFNVLLIDLRGHGRSQNIIQRYKSAHYNFKEIAEEIIEVLDYVKIEKAHFVGISLGTIIIRTIGEIDPNRISSMILGGAVTRLNIRAKVLVSVGNAFKKVIPYMWLYSLFAWIIMPRRRHKHSRMMFITEAKRLCQKEFIKWFRLTNEVNPLLRFFEEKEIPVPTLYLMGDEDHMFLPPVEMLVKRHQYASLRIIQNSGHVCNIDQPEDFNSEAIQFIHHIALSRGNIVAGCT